MLAVNHAMTGAVGWLIAGPLLAPGMTGTQLAVSTTVAAGAALAPDIDHPGSTVSRRLGLAGRAAAVGVGALAGGHRMLTHSLAFVALVGAGAYAAVALWGTAAAATLAAIPVLLALPLLVRRLPLAISGMSALLAATCLWWLIWAGWLDTAGWIVPAVTLGVLLHTVPGDLLTPSGVPLLAPFSTRRFAIPLFRTGSPTEGIVGTVLAGAGGWLVYTALSA